MPTKVVRAARTKQTARTTLGPRGRCVAPVSLVDEAFARARINKFNRLEPLANAIDSASGAHVADVLESYSTKHVS